MAQPFNACHVHYLRKDGMAGARPPTEAFAIRTIAQRNASFTLNDSSCLSRGHSAARAGRRDVRASAGYAARVISAQAVPASRARTSRAGAFGGFAPPPAPVRLR